MTVTVHGPYSSKYKAISHAQQNRRLQKAQRTGGKLNLTAQEIESSALDLLVKCVTAWSITLDGSCPECSEAKVKEVFANFPWMRDQVEAATNDTQAFLG